MYGTRNTKKNQFKRLKQLDPQKAKNWENQLKNKAYPSHLPRVTMFKAFALDPSFSRIRWRSRDTPCISVTRPAPSRPSTTGPRRRLLLQTQETTSTAS